MAVNVQHPLQAVKERRQHLGIPAADIAKRLGLDIQSYWRLERGERRCYFDRALVLAKMLGCTAEQLGEFPNEAEALELYKRQLARKLSEREASTTDGWIDEPEEAQTDLSTEELIAQWKD